MKKEYQKPTVEIIDFLSKEMLANSILEGDENEALALYNIGGEFGESALPDGWE